MVSWSALLLPFRLDLRVADVGVDPDPDFLLRLDFLLEDMGRPMTSGGSAGDAWPLYFAFNGQPRHPQRTR